MIDLFLIQKKLDLGLLALRGVDTATPPHGGRVAGDAGAVFAKNWKSYTHWIGLGEMLQENRIFDGKNLWFPVDFPEPMDQSIDMEKPQMGVQ
jgi:hypothetical protein